jgi:hypothetical protein
MHISDSQAHPSKQADRKRLLEEVFGNHVLHAIVKAKFFAFFSKSLLGCCHWHGLAAQSPRRLTNTSYYLCTWDGK